MGLTGADGRVLRRGWGAAAVLVALLLVGGCGDGDDGDDGDDERAEPVTDEVAASDALLDSLDDDGPGCAAAVAVEGETVWSGARGLADLEEATPIDEATVFDVGSTSKPFTATLLLLLDERGALDLDAPLSDLVDGLPAWADEVTLHQLLHHTAGVADYVELLYDEGFEDADTTTTEDALDALAAVEALDFEPGSDFEYSNSGYLLAAVAAEAATGEDFAELVAAELFEPYDLDAVVDPLLADAAKATSYEDDGEGWVVADSVWEQVGDGAIQTRPTELVRWAAELWDPRIGEAVDEARLATVVDDGEGAGYGAGIVVEEDERGVLLSHSGGWAGFVSDLVVRPNDEVAAAVACNTPDLLDPSEVAVELLEVWSD